MTKRKDHWEHVWTSADETGRSWYQKRPDRSLDLVAEFAPPGGRVIDVGGGSSRLVDGLLEAGLTPSVLDISSAALAISRTRLGGRASEVEWIVADVTTFEPDQVWDVWHDRAAFHFLLDPADRAAYVRAAARGVSPGGVAVIASFGADGPRRCSGLDTRGYGAPALAAEFGEDFRLERAETESHVKPNGDTQQFQWVVLRRV